jgi:hypothetical protein
VPEDRARPPARSRRAEATALPGWIKPQLTKLVEQPPDGSEWLHELKFDGYRMHERLDRGAVRLLTRTGLDWTLKYPAIAAAVASLPARQAYLDGELTFPFGEGACRVRLGRCGDGFLSHHAKIWPKMAFTTRESDRSGEAGVNVAAWLNRLGLEQYEQAFRVPTIGFNCCLGWSLIGRGGSDPRRKILGPRHIAPQVFRPIGPNNVVRDAQ